MASITTTSTTRCFIRTAGVVPAVRVAEPSAGLVPTNQVDLSR
ncbi:hypothetical protein MYSI104531_24665 [Mycobacterium simiae]